MRSEERNTTGPALAATALAAAVLAFLAIVPASASAADPGRWDLTTRSEIPLVYFQGITSAPDGDMFFDGINVGLYRSSAQLSQEAAVDNVIPPDVATAESYNHVGDITHDDADGGRILLPLECYYPGAGGNTCKTGSIGVADPDTLAWEYYVKLDDGPIKKAMWAEVDSTGTELYTQGSQPSGSNDNTLLVYDTADITASKAVGAPGAEDVVPEHAYPNVFTSGVTGAAYLNGRLYFASSSHVAGQLTDTFRIQSVDPHAFNPGDTDADRAVDIAATRRLEVELQVAGESEGLDFNGNLGGVLHWQIQPIPSDLVGQKPTYPPGIGTILSFVPDATATDVHDSDADGIPDADDACPDAAAGDQPDGCANGNPAPGNDPDRDGVVTASDNCADVPNNFQANADQDAQGDACDPDDDNDTVLDGPDNCDFSANPDQKDTDGDGIGDACSDDDDADTVVDWRDNCPLTPNPDQADSDGDGIGDACEDVTPPPTTDTTPPETTIGKIKVKKSTATIKFATTEPGGSFECKLDGKKVKKCAPPLKLKKLKPGKHRFEVAATDAAGNTDPTPAKAKFKVKKAKKGKHGGKGKGGK